LPHDTCNGEEVAQREPYFSVLKPADMIRHVAATLSRYGETRETGDWLILGTLIRPVPVHVGDRFVADFGPLGRVSVSVVG
jgi:2-keto-4-pentenoate hydratase